MKSWENCSKTLSLNYQKIVWMCCRRLESFTTSEYFCKDVVIRWRELCSVDNWPSESWQTELLGPLLHMQDAMQEYVSIEEAHGQSSCIDSQQKAVHYPEREETVCMQLLWTWVQVGADDENAHEDPHWTTWHPLSCCWVQQAFHTAQHSLFPRAHPFRRETAYVCSLRSSLQTCCRCLSAHENPHGTQASPLWQLPNDVPSRMWPANAFTRSHSRTTVSVSNLPEKFQDEKDIKPPYSGAAQRWDTMAL